MTNPYHRCLLGFSLLLTAALTAAAQNYRPFGPGRTYHYREAAAVAGASDEVFTFVVDSSAATATDSVFWFNRVHPMTRIGQLTVLTSPGRYATRLGLFGSYCTWEAHTGRARFGADGSAEILTLLTRAAVGQSWPFGAGLTATLTARERTTVLGRADSVVTIVLSDGQTLRIGQITGYQAGPSFEAYFQRSAWTPFSGVPRVVSLAGVPEVSGTSGADLRWNTIWDWQSGDQFFYADSTSFEDISIGPNPRPPYSTRSWRSLTVLTRQVVRDTLHFTFASTGYGIAYGSSNWSGTPTGYPVVAAWQAPLTIPLQQLALLSGTNGSDQPIVTYQPVNTSWIQSRPDIYEGLVRAQLSSFHPDGGLEAWYAPTLGVTYYAEYRGGPNSQSLRSTRLIGYTKNNGLRRWGNTAAPQPLAAPAEQTTLAATLAPNPAAAATTLRLTLPRATALHLTLLDPLGRAVWQQTSPQPAGDVAVAVPTAGLPVGVYHLRVAGASGRPVVLPLMRAE